MRKFLILEDSSNKFAYQIIDDFTEIYHSPYIYDEIFCYENLISDYLQQDAIRLKIGNLYGVLNGYTNELVLDVMYDSIELQELYNIYIYQTLITYEDTHNKRDADGNLLIHSNYRIFHSDGSVIVNQDYTFIQWMGYYENTYDNLFKVEVESWNGTDYVYSVGVINLKGQVVVAPQEKYQKAHHRVSDYIILEIDTVDINDNIVITYDIYSCNGILLYEGVSDYFFLNSK